MTEKFEEDSDDNNDIGNNKIQNKTLQLTNQNRLVKKSFNTQYSSFFVLEKMLLSL